ncbi:MAG: ATP-grasp domain-containing protein [Desulfobacteraceae bacterium]|jgi:predicted ATP-grasp superfamily ATP-dependent carboligase|nr:ATP-grasp domain-containing protein [Desulfobacteraceae bacterium]
MRVLIATHSAADQRKTLAAVRSLGRRGCRVTVTCDRGWCAPALSRYCRERIVCPSPQTSPDAFLDHLVDLVASGHYDVLLPLSDETTMPISRHAVRLSPHVGLCVPDWADLDRAHDKLETLVLARRLGLAVPETWAPASRQELEHISRTLAYPCVWKLRRGAGGLGLRFPANPDELMACWATLRPTSDPVYDTGRPLVQEYIGGDVHDVGALFNRGRVRAAMTQKRLLMYPVRGGIGIYNITTDQPELRDQAIALLEALHWHGPAAVEFRFDPRDGRHKIMEVNGRFWGTLGLAIHSGMDFPWLAAQIARHRDAPPTLAYRKQLACRWIIPFSVRQAREHHSLRAWWRFVRPRHGTVSEILLSDPLPHASDLLRALSSGQAGRGDDAMTY